MINWQRVCRTWCQWTVVDLWHFTLVDVRRLVTWPRRRCWSLSYRTDCCRCWSRPVFICKTTNLAIANGSPVSCAHKATTVLKWPWHVIQGHRKRHGSIERIMMSYHRSIVTMALSCISHIQPDIGRKSRNLYTPPTLNPPYWVIPLEFCKVVYW